jgi:DNA modification methylase
MEVGHTNPPVEWAVASHPGTTSENPTPAVQSDFRTPPKNKRRKSGSGPGPQACAQAQLHLRALTRNVEDVLRHAETTQAALTEEYIQAGRLLWDIKAECKVCGERFKDVLVREFPGRKRATLREYMTLSRGIDAADEATKVQWLDFSDTVGGPVLNEIRSLKKRRKAKLCQPAQGDTAQGENLKILFGDCMVRLRELPDESVDCVITSPPYYRSVIFPGANTVFGGEPHCTHGWEMRHVHQRHFPRERDVVETGRCLKCGADKAMLGWEDTVAEYVQHLVRVLREVKRVLKPAGVVCINIADTVLDGRLQLVPQRLAIALEDDGWVYCQEVIWHITNRAPEISTRRFGRDHEPLLMFAKRTDHYFDAAAAPQQRAVGDPKRGEEDFDRSKGNFKGTAGAWPHLSRGRAPNGLRSRRTVWSIPIEQFRGGHHCPFPTALVEPMLLSSCPEGGVCLDPFGGTGTVGLVALAHGRRAVLIEANPDYCAIAKHRIETELQPYKAKLEKRRRQERTAALLTPTSGIIVPGDASDDTAMREIEAA